MYISILIQVILMEEKTLQPGAEEKSKPQIKNKSKLDQKKVKKQPKAADKNIATQKDELKGVSKKINSISNILIQLNISGETSKYGFQYEEADGLITRDFLKKYNNINLRGFMGMASFTEDDNIIKKQFDKLNNFFIKKKKQIETVDTLSMGMSNDYKLALKCGSNMIRLGSLIFGERNY